MTTKWVSWFLESFNNKVLWVGWIPYTNKTANDLIAPGFNPQYTKERYDSSDPWQLCLEVGTGGGTIAVQFQRADGSTYFSYSNDFVGGRPIKKPI